MFNIEREDKIIEILKEKNSISVNDLAKILFTSTSTIRRDLTNLENKGLVVRTFGGVYLTKNRFNKETPFKYREEINITEKRKMCLHCLPFIKDNMSLFIDSSTTTLQIVNYLNNFKDLTIITNGLEITNLILKNTKHQVILLGGFIQNNSNSLLGSLTTNNLSSLHADISIMSSTGIDVTFGLSESTLDQAEIKKLMNLNSDMCIYLIDNTKFDKKGIITSSPIKDVDILITNKKPDEIYINLFKSNNIKLIY